MASQTAIILAAGLGKRMKSAMPKVLHPIAGRPLLHYPVRAALDAGCDDVVVVVGHGRDISPSNTCKRPSIRASARWSRRPSTAPVTPRRWASPH